MKKLSLFSLFGLLAFFAMPIYAQESDVYFDEGYIVVSDDASVEDVAVNDELKSEEEENDVVLTVGEEPIIERDMDEGLIAPSIPDVSLPIGSSNSKISPAGVIALAGFFGLLGVLIVYCFFVYGSLLPISNWEIYRRAGKKGWAWLVPFRGSMVYSEIAGMSKWLGLIPRLGVICMYLTGVIPEDICSILILVFAILTLIWVIVANYRIARRYGWGKFAAVLHALIIFCPITILVLGLGNYKYQGNSETVVEA